MVSKKVAAEVSPVAAEILFFDLVNVHVQSFFSAPSQEPTRASATGSLRSSDAEMPSAPKIQVSSPQDGGEMKNHRDSCLPIECGDLKGVGISIQTHQMTNMLVMRNGYRYEKYHTIGCTQRL